MQSNQDAVYRPNAIRALCKIIDVRPLTVFNSQLLTFSQPAMVQSVERYFKAYIVDKNSSIASAALVSAYHLYPKAENVAKRWVSEALEALSPKSSSSFFAAAQSSSLGGPSGYLGFGSSAPATPTMVSIPSTSYISQYHALGFLYCIRQSDRMAVTKMIQQLGGGKSGAGTSLKNPMALCMLIRYASLPFQKPPKANVRPPRRLAAPQERHGQLRGRPRHLPDARGDCSSTHALDRPVAIVPLFPQADPQVCCHPYAQRVGCFTSVQRGGMQRRHGEPHL